MRVPYRPRRPLRPAGTAALGLAVAVLTAAFAVAPGPASASAGTPALSAINYSLHPMAGTITGPYTAKRMSVDVALTPRDQTGLNAELSAVYAKGSGQYHKFLAKGQFDQRYAPAAATVGAVTSYLAGHGLRVTATGSPFALRATGSSTQIAATFRTALSNYTNARGNRYYANSSPVYVPKPLAGAISSVVGLTNTVRLQPMGPHPSGRVYRPSAHERAATSCETGYPTPQQIFNAVNTGVGANSYPTVGYGAGPGCTGLTPSQTNSIYGAPPASARTQGTGVTAAVIEQSGYLPSDIQTWAHQFYGAGYTANVTQRNVDSGPLNGEINCPAGDACYDNFNHDYQVDADVEQELAVAPDAAIQVYDAPDDQTGQVALDEYNAVAKDDTASTVSTSYGMCEPFAVNAGLVQAENTVFRQMALQGQSVFAAAGDSSAFGCWATFNPFYESAQDPAAQPWVIGVGGTSLSTDNPGTSASPGPPAAGVETAWNADNLCSQAAPAPSNNNAGGWAWCFGNAGGGDPSMYWAAPSWQTGPGVSSPGALSGPANCTLASSNSTLCRQVPDVSANADRYDPYPEYCTGNDVTSYCAGLSGGGGWFQASGTAMAAPLWAALIADRDSYKGARSGNIGSLIYGNPSKYLNDIATPAPSSEPGVVPATGNGFFPATPGYDEATGLGSPKFTAMIEG